MYYFKSMFYFSANIFWANKVFLYIHFIVSGCHTDWFPGVKLSTLFSLRIKSLRIKKRRTNLTLSQDRKKLFGCMIFKINTTDLIFSQLIENVC